ncbi:unnamed protein product [marine sediment metagenome]|uniref:Uncharacterized protein n=1 Tax=marine sediment metagenome TaxID=412755 RepID=X0SK33_9ZZZZ
MFYIFLYLVSYNLILPTPSITTYQYYDNYISINNIKYRESNSIYKPSSLVTISLKAGNWKVSDKPIYIYPGIASCVTNNLKDQLILKYEKKQLLSLLIRNNIDNGHLVISSVISGKGLTEFDKNRYPYYYIKLNNKKIIGESTPYFSTFLKKKVSKSINNISLWVDNGNSSWCICPSINNGFNFVEQLCAWMEYPNNKVDRELISKSSFNNSISEKVISQSSITLSLHIHETNIS